MVAIRAAAAAPLVGWSIVAASMVSVETIKVGDAEVNLRDVAGVTRRGGRDSLALVVHTFPVKKVRGGRPISLEPTSLTRFKLQCPRPAMTIVFTCAWRVQPIRTGAGSIPARVAHR